MNPRQYQIDHIERIIEQVSAKRKVLAQLPTGGGKTVEFALIAQRYIRNTGNAVLILVHREELMNQAAKTIKNITGYDPVLITSQSKHYRVARVYIGMVESTVSRLELFDNVGLVIIDECHMANFNKMHLVFLEESIIGFTATPISSSKKEPLNKYYNSIVVGPSIKELIKLGHLSQNITRCPKDIVDSTKLEIDNRKGDYNENKMAAEYKLPRYVINTVKAYRKFCNRQKCIVFNVNIDHSKAVNECFQDWGYNSRHLDSNCTSEERKEILKWFKETPDAILNNVMIATVGFDEPTVRNVILNFSTLSLPKFIQCCGRGSRYIDEELALILGDKPKDHFNIIDLGGNSVRFNSDWNDDRDWEYIFNNPGSPGNGIAPVKTCPQCDGLIHAALMICPLKNEEDEFCSYEFERRKTPEEQDLEEMILITKDIDINELIEKGRKKYEYYPFLELGVDVVNAMYKSFPDPSEAVKQRWFSGYYELCKQWYNKTLAGVNGNIIDISESAWHMRIAQNNFNSLVEKLKPKTIELQTGKVISMNQYASMYGR